MLHRGNGTSRFIYHDGSKRSSLRRDKILLKLINRHNGLITILFLSFAFGQLSLEISTDTSFYVENQNIEITLSLINQSSDTNYIVFPGSMPYWIYLDSVYLWGGGGFAVLIPQVLGPYEATEWNFVYDDYLPVGNHHFSAGINFYPTWADYDTLIYLSSNLAKFYVSEYLETLPEKRPEKYSLINNYPNPFNSTTTIQYSLSKASYVELHIYSINGAKVKTLVEDRLKSGTHHTLWNGTDKFGKPVSAGIYFCILRFENSLLKRKMILLK